MLRDSPYWKYVSASLALSISLLSFSAQAESLPCTSYHRELKYWGLTGVSPSRQEDHCSKGEAIVFHGPVIGYNIEAGSVPLEGNCCPMPQGALLEDYSYAVDICPEDSVITGARYKGAGDRATGTYLYEVRCTKVNLNLYRLRPAQEIVQLEYGRATRIDKALGSGKKWIHRRDIPKAYQKGMGRTGPFSWISSGCLALPWGSPLSGMGRNGCKGFEFKTLVPVTE